MNGKRSFIWYKKLHMMLSDACRIETSRQGVIRALLEAGLADISERVLTHPWIMSALRKAGCKPVIPDSVLHRWSLWETLLTYNSFIYCSALSAPPMCIHINNFCLNLINYRVLMWFVCAKIMLFPQKRTMNVNFFGLKSLIFYVFKSVFSECALMSFICILIVFFNRLNK